MRRFLAFILGMVIGIVFILAAIVGAVYVAVAVIHPNQVMPDSDRFIGDFADMSMVDMAKSVQDLYLKKIGVMSEDGKYFTLGEFLANYHIDTNRAFGIELPQDVLDIPAFEFFNENNGIENAMKQIKVSAIPAIANMFVGTNEDGTPNGLISESAVTELSNYSLYDLLSDESKGFPYVFQNIKFADILKDAFPQQDTDNKLMWAVGQSSIGKLLGGMAGENNMLLQLKAGGAFETLGNLSILEIIGDGDNTLRGIFRDVLTSDLIDDNGELNLDSVINGISLGEMLGCQKNEITDTSSYVAFITAKDENGEELDVIIRLNTGDNDNPSYIYAKLDGGKYFEAELTCDIVEHTHDEICNTSDKPCAKKEHLHDKTCYEFVWYTTNACEENHEHEGELEIENNHYKRTDGLYNVLANTSISDLTSGDSEALLNRFKGLTIGEILGDGEIKGVMANFADMTLSEIMNGAIDELFLGSFFNYERMLVADMSNYLVETTRPLYINEGETDAYPVYYVRSDNNCFALSTDQSTWYEGHFTCENENHSYDDHYAACYGFVWYVKCKEQHYGGLCDDDIQIGENVYKKATGIQSKLASKQIRNLQNLNNEIKSLTLYDVLGEDIPDVLQQIAHTPIGELNNAINDMYLGGLLNYIREEYDVATDGDSITLKLNEKSYNKSSDDILEFNADGETGYLLELEADVYALSEEGKAWFKAQLVCANEEHIVHNKRGCYAYVWYQLCEKDSHDECEKPVYEIDGNNYHIADGMMAKLAEKKVKEMGSLNETIKTFTLRDVLGKDIPEMLLTIADCEIGNLNNEIDKLYIGDVLKDKRLEITDSDNNYSTVFVSPKGIIVQYDNSNDKYRMSDNGKAFYETELICGEEHEHNEDCFEYVWYEACKEDDEHNSDDVVIAIDGENYHRIEGLTKHIVTIKIGELNSATLTNAINGMTVGEIITMDNDTNEILKSMQHVKIGDLGKEINNVYLGSAMNYIRREMSDDGYTILILEPSNDSSYMPFVKSKTTNDTTTYIKSDDGKIWYEAELTCHLTDGHNHNVDCYEYIWYVRCEEAQHNEENCQDDVIIDNANYKVVTGVTKAFVNSRLNGVANTMNHLTIRKLGIDITDNNLLIALQDVELNDLSSALTNTKMGVILGYDKCELDHEHTENCSWYKDGQAILGLNAKIANETVGGLAGGEALTNIAKNLTIGDLIDSEMMSISDEQTYKLAIMFCKTDSHHCSVAGYITNKAMDAELTAKRYWLNCHGKNESFLSDEDIEHRDSWKVLKLADFIDQLLGAI